MHITHGTYAHFAHHDHTHSHMHARVYKCTHCGHKSHLARFFFDRLNHVNFVNNNVWLPYDANPRGPERKWVPKFLPLVFDVGVGSHMT